MDPPETYGLPSEVKAQVPSRSVWPASLKAIAASLIIALGAFVVVRPAEGAGRRGGRAGECAAMNLELNTSVADPGWHGLIVWYFFLGGIAAGAYVMAALADLFGDADDRPGVRVAYYLAFPLVGVCGLLLTIDLGRPERFWHMLIQSNTGRPMFKWWSPMSVGLVGPLGLRAVQLRVVRGRPGRGRLARSEAVLAAGLAAADRLDRPALRAGRLAVGVLPGLVHGRLAGGEQPAGLVEHDLDRGALPRLVGVDRASPPWSCSIAGCGSTSTNR